MTIKKNNSTSVKELMKFIYWEQNLRSNWLVGESNTSLFGWSTWNNRKREKVKKNYIKRISSGKVPVFYLDLIEHCIEEKKYDLPRESEVTFNFTTDINHINGILRLIAYYEAIIELGINHRTSPEQKEV
jgi:hypothetical protein